MADLQPGSTYFDSLEKKTNAELYREAKAMRDAMIKRYKRLDANVKKDPASYSVFGLRALQDPQTGEMSIPMVSKGMSRRALKTQANRLNTMMAMKTTTSTGARKHQNEVIRNIAGVPLTGRLNKEEREKVKRYKQHVVQNPEAMSNFWRAFDHYKETEAYRNLDSHQLLEEFRAVYNNLTDAGAKDPADFFAGIDQYSKEQYEEREAQELADIIGRAEGMFEI